MVEVMRTAMHDLAEILSERFNFELPKSGFWQFDNGGENKARSDQSLLPHLTFYLCQNKTMFMYGSLLIEQLFLDKLHINFLVAGHTHCENDQVYSSYSHVLKRKVLFIATPLGLEYYIQEVGRSESEKIQGKRGAVVNEDEEEAIESMKHYRRASIFRRIDVIYDVAKLLSRFLNTAIKYHQVPHCFM